MPNDGPLYGGSTTHGGVQCMGTTRKHTRCIRTVYGTTVDEAPVAVCRFHSTQFLAIYEATREEREQRATERRRRWLQELYGNEYREEMLQRQHDHYPNL